METKSCSQCRKPISPQAKYCTYCGASTSTHKENISKRHRKFPYWVAAIIAVALCCIAGFAVTAFLLLKSDIPINIPGLTRNRPTPTAREAGSPRPRATDNELDTTIPPEILVVEMTDEPVSEYQGVRIEVATDATWPPFEVLNEQGEIIGFDIDLMNAIADRVGFQVEYLNVPWDTLLSGVASCDYQVAISGIYITPDRQELMLFSNPYIDDGQVILARVDNPDITGQDSLVGHEVAVQIGTAGEELIRDLPGVTMIVFENIELSVMALTDDMVDAVVTNRVAALGYVGESAGELHIVGESLTKDLLGIALCRDNSALQAEINRALAELHSEGYLEELAQTWFVDPNR